MRQGNISVHTENIFPIIKKFLYSDHEIFLRELISNAVDATQKIKTLASVGEFKGELGELKITVTLDEATKTLTISDNGLGMTADDIEKYINQLAFSGAEEFVTKYKDKADANIIGHFGLGFYSAFMVAHQVEIQTLSHKEGSEAAHWTCDGSTSFTIDKGTRTERGTDIILHIAEDSEEFLQKYRVNSLLEKYCRFLPVEIEFDGKVINNTKPIWIQKPSELTDDDYTKFYSELYPYAEPPLFWIHLNVDYPFNLTGILYFPKVSNAIDAEKHKVQLYSNQVFVTDNVKDILPEFLMLLHGVIDSPDIPLNVSRSSLQSDSNVKKITSHISKKVSDKLSDLFKADRKDFDAKWPSMDIFVKYGMLSDEKFAERAQEFCLLENVKGEYSLIKEYVEKIKPLQTNKEETVVALYTSDPIGQHSYIKAAQDKGYDVLKLDGMLDVHFVGQLEQKQEKLSVKRVDADIIDKLVDKGEERVSVLTDKDVEKLKTLFSDVADKVKFSVEAEALSPEASFITITEDEFARRMREMSRMQNMTMFGNMPDHFKIIINSNHAKAKKLLEAKGAAKKDMVKQILDLAMLSKNMLTGEHLTDFVNRSMEAV
ncbi:MAG: molecular chaperone HtpG [Bacteroidia bacterium]|nr:molecular chaperone HtpG [Bacteroidia bacterium]